eukprot:gene15837-21960_t
MFEAGSGSRTLVLVSYSVLLRLGSSIDLAEDTDRRGATTIFLTRSMAYGSMWSGWVLGTSATSATKDSSDGEPDSDEITDSEDGEGYSCLDSGAFLHSVPDLRRLFLTTQDNSASLLSPAPDSSGTKQLILANRTFSLPSVPLCSSLEPEGETQVKGRWQAGQPPQRAAKQLLLSMLENFKSVLLSAPGSYLSHSTSLSDSGSPRPGTGTHSSGSPRLVTGTYSSSSSSACSPRLLPLLVSAAASDCPPLLGATAASDCPPLQGVAATSGCPPLLVVAAEEPVWLPETVTCGLCCEQGARASNEDMAFALEIYEKPMEHGSGDSPMSQPFSRAACFGVFDGHGGVEAAEYMTQNVPGSISNGYSHIGYSESGVEAAEHMTQNLPGLISKRCSHIKAQGAEEVTSIMLTLEAQLQERFNTEWYSMDRDPGTTALVATIIDDTLLVANVS